MQSDAAGHHNIAWELNHDRRFRRANGTLENLLQEVAAHQAPVTVISSEDFEYLHARPESLERLASGFRSIGYDARIVLYVRSRAEYAQSLYAELVKHGLACGFFAFILIIIRDRVFTFADNWAFGVSYSVIIEPFAEAFGRANVVVRPYATGSEAASLERDFLSVIDVDTPGYIVPETGRPNQSLSLIGVLDALYSNVRGLRDVGPEPLALAAEVMSDNDRSTLSNKFEPLGDADTIAFESRFAKDDAFLRACYGVDLGSTRERVLSAKPALQKRLMLAAEERWGLAP